MVAIMASISEWGMWVGRWIHDPILFGQDHVWRYAASGSSAEAGVGVYLWSAAMVAQLGGLRRLLEARWCAFTDLILRCVEQFRC